MATEKTKWTFPSKSNPSATPHELTLWDDGRLSCNCNGWTRRVAEDGSRTCPHVRMHEQDLADRYALGVWHNPRLTVHPALAPRDIRLDSTTLKPWQESDSRMAKVKEQVKKERPALEAPLRKINWKRS